MSDSTISVINRDRSKIQAVLVGSVNVPLASKVMIDKREFSTIDLALFNWLAILCSIDNF